jgi:hypothetical protein
MLFRVMDTGPGAKEGAVPSLIIKMVCPATDSEKGPEGPVIVPRVAALTLKPAGKSISIFELPGKLDAVVKATTCVVVAPATAEVGVLETLVRLPAAKAGTAVNHNGANSTTVAHNRADILLRDISHRLFIGFASRSFVRSPFFLTCLPFVAVF